MATITRMKEQLADLERRVKALEDKASKPKATSKSAPKSEDD